MNNIMPNISNKEMELLKESIVTSRNNTKKTGTAKTIAPTVLVIHLSTSFRISGILVNKIHA